MPVESIGRDYQGSDSSINLDGRSQGMRALNNLFDDAYNFGRQTVGDLQKHGPAMLNSVVEEVKKDPRKGIEAVAVLGLTATAVAAESPVLIGVASAGAILGGIHLAGEACASEANKWNDTVRKGH